MCRCRGHMHPGFEGEHSSTCCIGCIVMALCVTESPTVCLLGGSVSHHVLGRLSVCHTMHCFDMPHEHCWLAIAGLQVYQSRTWLLLPPSTAAAQDQSVHWVTQQARSTLCPCARQVWQFRPLPKRLSVTFRDSSCAALHCCKERHARGAMQ